MSCQYGSGRAWKTRDKLLRWGQESDVATQCRTGSVSDRVATQVPILGYL
jgi:hypothetical protein